MELQRKCDPVVGRGEQDDAEIISPSVEHRLPAVVTAVGWTAVVALGVVIAVLTTVLAGMLLVVSLWLTVAVPIVVLLAVVAVVAYAKRG